MNTFLRETPGLPSPDRIPQFAGLAVFVLMLVRVIHFYLAPNASLIGVIPDDAFYYLQLAHHKAVDGFWTFDGVTVATGFHRLYGYLLAVLYTLSSSLDWRHMYLSIGFLSSVSIGLSAYLVAKTAAQNFGFGATPIAIAPFLTTTAMFQSTAMMESWMVLLCSAATLHVAYREKSVTFIGAAGLIALGFFGSLARSDYGMLPGVLFVVSAIMRRNANSQAPTRSFFILAGAVIGVIIVLAHNWYISGQLFQASAQTKLYWSMMRGNSFAASTALVLRVAIPGFDTLRFISKVGGFCVLLTLLGIAALRYIRMGKPERQALVGFPLAIGCFCTLLGYIFFYHYDSDSLQSWYSGNLIAPVSLLIAAAFTATWNRNHIVPSIAGLLLYALYGVAHIFEIPWPHQSGLMNAGLTMRQWPSGSTYAAWNAGIISYFSGLPIINIDGLTNDEVVPYIKSNGLFDYLVLRKVRFLVDFDVMIEWQAYRRRGGYVDERMDHCLHRDSMLGADSVGFGGSRVWLFEVTAQCQ